MNNEELYIKPDVAAKRLNVTRQAIYKWIREGRLQGVRFGEVRGVRIPRAALEEFEQKARQDVVEIVEKNQAPGLVGVAA